MIDTNFSKDYLRSIAGILDQLEQEPILTSARLLLGTGAAAVLVKGGHARGPEVEDLLVTPGRTEVLRAPRLPGPEVHGTGCYLSSAIAALLALGRTLEAAVRAATRDLRELRGRSERRAGDGFLARLPIFPE